MADIEKYGYYKEYSTENLVLEREELLEEVKEAELDLKRKQVPRQAISETESDIRYNSHKIEYINKLLQEREATSAMINEIINAHKKTKGRR